MTKFALTFFLGLYSFSAFGQGTLTGPNTGTVNSAAQQYSYTNIYTSAQWSISPSGIGTVMSQSLSPNRDVAYANIKWNYPGTATITLKKNNLSTVLATRTVSVTCPGMSPPSVSSTRGGVASTQSCTPASFLLVASLPSGATSARWYTASSGGTLLMDDIAFDTPTLPNNSSTTYYVSSMYGSSCESSTRTAVTLTISAAPSPPTLVSQDNAVCGSGTAVLYASPGVNGNTYKWYTTGGSYLAQGPYNPYISSPTTYNVTSYHTGTGCESSPVTYSVEITAVPLAPQVWSSSVCGSGNVTISAAPGTSGGYINWYNTSDIYEATSSTLTRNVSVNTTYNAKTVVNNSIGASCFSAPVGATMYVNPLPAAPSLNAQTVCGPQTVTLTGTAGSGNTLRWFNAASGGSEISYSQYVSATTTFYASAINASNSCESASRSSVTITVNPLPALPTFTYESYICDATGVANLTASAGGNYIRWYANSSGGSPLTPAVPNGTIFNTPTLSSPTTYYISSYNTSTGCESASRVSVPVNFYTRPPAPSVVNAARCGTGSVTLQASSGYSMFWTANDITISPNPNTSYTTPSLSSTTSYKVYSYTAQCASTPATVTATINTIPSTPTLTPQSLCPGTVTLAGTVGAGGTDIRWYAGASGGSPIPSSQTVSTTTTFYASSYNSTTQCESARSSVVITVYPVPAQPTFSYETYICEPTGGTQEIYGFAGANTVKWYTTASGGTPLTVSDPSGQFFTTPTLTAPTTYYISARNTNGCESSPRVSVPVNFYTKPAKPVAASNAMCLAGSGTENLVLTASAGAGESLYWTDTNGVTVNNGSTYTVSSAVPVVQTFNVHAYTTQCVSDPQTVTATFNARPATIDQDLLGNSLVRFSGQVTLFSETYAKFYSSDGTTHLKTGFEYTTPVITTSTTYQVAAFNPSTGCESLSKTAKVATILPLISKGSLKTEIVRTPVALANASQIDAMTTLDQRVVQTTHFDGLLRPVQQNLVKASAAGTDVVQPIVYDPFGRSPVQYLPYVSTSTTGAFQDDHNIKQPQFYLQAGDRVANDSMPYARTIYEASPLGRAMEMGNFGKGYQPEQGHSSKVFYSYNTGATTGDTDEVRLFDSNGNSTGFYAANKLNKITAIDPDGKITIVFTDGSGNLICRKQQLDEQIDGVTVAYLQTYYIYDEAGRVKYVITPKGISILKTNGWSLDPIKSQHVYQVRYDARGRVIEKKVPGQGWMKYIYDRFNRLVLMQDTILRGSTQWMFLKYDNFGRTVMQGLYTNTVQTSRVDVQNLVNTMYRTSNALHPPSTRFETRGTSLGYSNISFPKQNQNTSPLAIHSYTFYDNYDFDNNGVEDYTYTAQNLSGEQISPQSHSIYLPTGSKTLILNGTGNNLISYTFYDREGRPIQSRSNNHLNLTVDKLSTSVYDFEGKVVSTRNYDPNAPEVINRFEYEPSGKLKKVFGPSPIGENMTWGSGANVSTAVINEVTKTLNSGNWDAGVISTNSLNANQDGWVEFQAGETTTYKMVGLATANSNTNYNSITFAMYASINGSLSIYESGASKGTVGTYTVNDVLKVERRNGQIFYKKNNQIVYTSATTNTGILYVDVAINSYNGKVKNVKLYRNNEITLAHYQYNDLGQLVDKKLHSTNGTDYLQSVDYRYTIRGQLASINNAALNVESEVNDETNDLFGIEYLYHKQESGLGNNAYYNGNISATKWKGPGAQAGLQDQKSYKFVYDKANQLRSAISAVRSASAWDKELNALNEVMTYDHNGNIKTLQRNQRQHQLVGVSPNYISQTMDNLAYTYDNANGDRLLKVEDASGITAGFYNGSTAATEFTYDGNGNLTADANKSITSIAYNHLGKPTLITYGDGKKVEYTYSAAGAKLKMRTLNGATVLTTTDYVGSMVYESTGTDPVTLKFYGSTEGRVMVNGSDREYQYSISDHQGNTRIVFTSKTPAAYAPIATFEGDSGDQSAEFKNVTNIVSFVAANQTAGGNKVIRMNQSYPVGPSKSMKVYPGDKVDMEVYAYYETASGYGTNNVALGSMITSVAGAFTIGMSPVDMTVVNSAVNSALTAVGLGGNQGDAVPAAYLNYILYDKDYKLLNAGWQAVPASANFAKQKLSIPTRDITEPGYVFVYLSYENQSNNYVYFDDFKVTHTKTNVIQSNDYYPFGLAAGTSWTREGSKNDFMYNAGSEINVTTGWYDLPFRNYDPALGRFMQVDPMAESEMATYQYVGNNPVMMNDPMGSDKKSNAQIHAEGMAAFNERVNASASYSAFDTEWASDGGGGGGYSYRGAAEQMKARGEAMAAAHAGDPNAVMEYGRQYGEELEWNEFGGDQISRDEWLALGGDPNKSADLYYSGGFEVVENNKHNPNYEFKVVHSANDSFEYDWFIETTWSINRTHRKQTAVMIVYSLEEGKNYGKVVQFVGQTRHVSRNAGGFTVTALPYEPSREMQQWIDGATGFHSRFHNSDLLNKYINFILTPGPSKYPNPFDLNPARKINRMTAVTSIHR